MERNEHGGDRRSSSFQPENLKVDEYRAALADTATPIATNHAAEVKLRAERKAGELLTALAEQSKEEQRRGNRYTLESYQADNSLETPYRAALADTATPIATAQRWQTVAPLAES